MKKRQNNNFLIILACGVFFLSLFIIQNPFGPKKEIVAEGFNADLSGEVNFAERMGYWNGQNYEIPEVAFNKEVSKQVLGATAAEKWVEVDLSEQKLYAWEGDKLHFETLISSGLPNTPTPTGEFNIWIKLRSTKMEGGSGRGYYYLPNVPYTMFFENEDVPGWKGYGLHGTYWHSDFGTQRSHGCINLPTPMAKQLYEWVNPELSEGRGTVRSSDENPGTRVVIHE